MMLGTRIGSSGFLEEIGKGGMATVYRARHAGVDRDVAIKVIGRDTAGDADAAQHFPRDARRIGRLGGRG
jgi:serine/threonine-protein kinase